MITVKEAHLADLCISSAVNGGFNIEGKLPAATCLKISAHFKGSNAARQFLRELSASHVFSVFDMTECVL